MSSRRHNWKCICCCSLCIIILGSVCGHFITPANGAEIRGDISLEGFFFLSNPAWEHQENQSASIAGNIEFFHDFQDSLSFTLEGFYRLDSQDKERSHGDLRLAEFLYYTDNFEITAGFGHVFWGATEFVHLVDIINQTDQVDALDGEEKLGQPMIHLSVPLNACVLEAFALPWFRERTFPGRNGRFRSPLPVDTDSVRYESPSKEHHQDFSLRASTNFADADVGLSYFRGTARDPVLLPSFDQASGTALLYPYYQQINQTGLDIQLIAEECLLKGEAYYRTGQSRSYVATTFGFEYTFVGVAETMMDMGIIGEYVFDDRDTGWLPTLFENDIMGGIRLTVNDMASSTLLLGLIRDLDSGSTIISIETSRRLGDAVRINLDASFFVDMNDQDPAFTMAKDDFIKLELAWYW
jgi:hypothetical protein